MTPTPNTLAGPATGLEFTESPSGTARNCGSSTSMTSGQDGGPRGLRRHRAGSAVSSERVDLVPDGSLVSGDAFQRRIHRWQGSALEEVAQIARSPNCWPRTASCNRHGFLGDIGYNFVDPAAKPVDTCVIVLVDAGGKASVVADNLSFPNGMVITPDGRSLIVAETLGHRLSAFEIRTDGTLGNRRTWAQLPPSISPDGICLDAAGGVWCANPEGEDSVVRVCEGGKITDRIRVATHAYAVMLGGPLRRHLFISTSGSHDPAEIHRSPTASIEVLEVDVPGAGQP